MAIQGLGLPLPQLPAAGAERAALELPNPFPVQGGTAPAAGYPAAGGTDFGSSLEKALEGVDSKMREADATAAAYASGGPVEIHTVIIAAEQARLAITLAAEVRNKVLEAYQELTRTVG